MSEGPRSLISFDGIPPELVEAQSKKRLEALTNLFSGKTPKEVIYQRTIDAKKGIKVDYVPGWWFVSQLNALFGYYWDFEIQSHGIGQESCWVWGKLTIKDARTNLTVTKSAFGGSRLKSKDNPSIDIGDDLKAAATDSLKKAATLLGIAADVYGKREVQEETLSTKKQLEVLYQVGVKKGLTGLAIESKSKELFGKSPGELEQLEVLSLIRDIRSVPAQSVTKANP